MMMMMFPSRLFIFLTLVLLSYNHNMVTAQCAFHNYLKTTQVSSTQLTISLRCFDREADDEFQVTYQLMSRGQCDARNSRTDSPFDSRTTMWATGSVITTDFNNNNYQYTATLTNLLPYSTYSVSVQAKHPYGGGGYSLGNIVAIDPDPATSEAAPATFGSGNITSPTQYANQLDFQWTIPCSSRNGVITGYYYYWTLDFNGAPIGTTQTQTTSSVVPSRASITDLSCDTTYRFYVAGINDAGGGSYSEYQTATTTCCTIAPGSVTNLQQGTVTATYIQVTWSEPTFKGECPIIDSFEVTGTGVSLQSDCQSLFAHNLARQLSVSLSYTRTPAKPYYIYTISVNPVGGTILQLTVSTEQSAPAVAPANIQLTDSTSSSLTISWDEIPCAYRNGVITIYAYQLNSGSASPEVDATITSTSVNIQDLTPNTYYIFKVAALTSGGAGSLSSGDVFQTETVSVNPPTSISADNILSTSIRFSWNEASCPNPCPGGIIGYSWRLLLSGVANRSDTTNADQRTVTIVHLIPCTEYEFRVAGKSGDGIGSYSEGEIATTAGEAPGSVTNLQQGTVTATVIQVTWSEPTNKGCPIIDSYEVAGTGVSRLSGCPSLSEHTLAQQTSTSLSYTRGAARPYYTYTISVNPVGGQLEQLMVFTEQSAPTVAPTNIQLTDSTSSILTISWDEIPCAYRNGVITSYAYQLVKSGSASPEVDATTTSTSVTIQDLTPNTYYIFRVAALTSGGAGSFSSGDVFQTETVNTAPGIPVNLTVLDIEETSVRLQWKSPMMNSNGVRILDYPIKYKAIQKSYDSSFVQSDEAYVSSFAILNPGESIHGYTVDNLSPSTKYEFLVAGRISAGSGEYARIEVFTKAFTGLNQPNSPAVKIGQGVGIISFNDLPEFVSNVYIAVENANSRRRRQGGNNPLHAFIVANLTRKEVDEKMTFTVGDNKTYGGYPNHALIGGQTYAIRMAYASCTSEECLEEWSALSIFTAPSGTFNQLGPVIGGVFAVILVGVVLIALICYYRKSKASTKEKPEETTKDENEIYDEIDAKKEMMAKQQQQQRLQTMETGYEVNMAMETTSPRAQSDGSAYEDVNIKEEAEYQGLDLDAVDEEQTYQDLKGNTSGDKSAPQYANV